MKSTKILFSTMMLATVLKTKAFVVPAASYFSTLHGKSRPATTTILRLSSRPTTTNQKTRISNSAATSSYSSLTIPQLNDLLREQGVTPPTTTDSTNNNNSKAALVSQLSTLALQKKEDKLSELSAMASKMKKQKQMSSIVNPGPTPGLNQQVAVALETRKANAKANANGDKKKNTNTNAKSNVNADKNTKTNTNTNTNKKRNENKNANKNHINGFSEINVPPNLVTRLNEMGIVTPTPIQTQAIPHAIQGRDVMGLAQTGTGKTLAFGLPLISQMLERTTIDGVEQYQRKNKPAPKAVRSLVLAPTRELANQIAVHLGMLTQDTPLRTSVVVGGQSINAQISKLKAGTDLLVATPGRLIDLMDRGAVSLKGTTFLVLDEADLMLDMGFLPSLKKIAKILPTKRQTMLFSATMANDMDKVASTYLTNPIRVKAGRAGKTADKITQQIHFIAKADKGKKLLQLLEDPQHREDRAIVFGRTKHGMEKLSKKLIAAGIQAGSIHGNKSQSQRDRAIAAFKAGEIKVLVATDVAARGLDIPDVKHVYNYELPNVPEAYVHRIGRTARAGKEGSAIAFCSVEEMDDLADIEKVMGLQIPVVSGTPWSKDDTKRAKDRIKDNKLDQAKRQKESRNRKKQVSASGNQKKSHKGSS